MRTVQGLIIAALLAGSLACGPDLLQIADDHVRGFEAIVSQAAIHVHPDGSDENAGSEFAPKQSVTAAVQVAAALIDSGKLRSIEVRVSAGLYRFPATLEVPPGVSIVGGFTPTDWSRDLTINVSTLQLEGSGTVIEFPDGTTRETAIDGCVITALPAAEVIGIDCTGSSPTITRCTIDVTPGWETSIGVLLSGSDAIVDANTVLCGAADGNSWGIVCIGGAPRLSNNVIAGDLGGGMTVCIHCTGGATPTILNNTLHGGRTADDILLFLSTPVATIENNIFLGSVPSCAIWMSEADYAPASLKNNLFLTCIAPILHAEVGVDLATTSDVETYLGPTADSNATGPDP
ncbi:MAG: hypothetical protein KAU31_15295, partial [Spirochaetaceae bacterium]|nr:hypothetical protein [Spirochaetaceae bacterium]